jgi:hypothetical protein
MSMTADIFRLVLGLLFGMLVPRIPLLFFTRFLNLERGLHPHPDPTPVDVPLIQRMRLMRRVHGMGWILAILPLGLGLFVLRVSPQSFAFGLVAGVAWFAISRIVPQDVEMGLGIIPMSLVREVNNLRQIQSPCCDRPFLQWEVRAVRCRFCRAVHLSTPRPDLGRLRSDGRLIGAFRILLADGRSIFPLTESVELGGEVGEEE